MTLLGHRNYKDVFPSKIGNLSTDVFEPRTSTGSNIFPSLERFDAITFVTSNRRHKNKSFPVHGKEQNHAKKENFRLPVAVRGSKTSAFRATMQVSPLRVPKGKGKFSVRPFTSEMFSGTKISFSFTFFQKFPGRFANW